MKTLSTKRFIEHARYTDGDLWLDVTKSVLIVDGKLIGIVGSAKDITDIVSEEIKECFNEAESVEIDIDCIYCTEKLNGKRKCDLGTLLEKNRDEEII